MSIPEILKKNKELREFLHQFVSHGTTCTPKCEGCNDDIDAIIDMVCEDYEEAYEAEFKKKYGKECERMQVIQDRIVKKLRKD